VLRAAGAVRRIADDRRLALPASHAEGGEAVPGVAVLHLGQQGDEDPAAASPDRMSERDRLPKEGELQGTPLGRSPFRAEGQRVRESVVSRERHVGMNR
jgi:hypothetical protein